MTALTASDFNRFMVFLRSLQNRRHADFEHVSR